MFWLQNRFTETILWILGAAILLLGLGCSAEIRHRLTITDLTTDTSGSVEVTQPDLSKLPAPQPITAKQSAADASKAATRNKPPATADG